MKITKTTRKVKCAGDAECTEKVEFSRKFSKYNVHLCEKCARKLFESLGRCLVPKSIKSKFNLEN